MAGKAVMIIALIATILVIIGALNWGWIGLTNNNLINSINNSTFKNETLERTIYVLVGLSALFLIYFHIAYGRDMAKMCDVTM